MPLLSRNRKIALFSASALALVFIVVCYWLPLVIKAKLPGLIAEATGKSASIAQVQVQLLPLAVRIDDFSLNDNNQVMLSVGQVYLKIDVLASLSQQALVIAELVVSKPFVHVKKHADGHFNLMELAASKPSETNTSDNKIFPLSIQQLAITEGKLVYEDAQSPKTIAVYPIQLENKQFSTIGSATAELALALTLESGGHLSWTSNLTMQPLHFQGEIHLSQIDLQTLPLPQAIGGFLQADLPYEASIDDAGIEVKLKNAHVTLQKLLLSQAGLAVEASEISHETDLVFSYKNNAIKIVADRAKLDVKHLIGLQPIDAKVESISVASAYQMDFSNNQLNFQVKKAAFDGKNLQLTLPKHDKASLIIAAIAGQGLDFNLAQQSLGIQALSVNGAQLQATRLADGSFDLQTILPPTAAVAASGDTATVIAKPWLLHAKALSLINCGLNFTDASLATPTTINLNPINLSLTDFNSDAKTKMPLGFSMGVNKNGMVKLDGDVSLTPLAANLAVDIKNIDLEKFQNYYAQFIRLDVIDGMLGIDGKLAATINDKVDLTFSGNATVADFLTRDQRIHKDFLKWLNLRLSGIHLDTVANRFTADELNITRPYSRVTIRKDKTINYANLLIVPPEADKAITKVEKPAKKPPANPFYFNLAKIRITDASTNFSDLSLILPFSAYVQDMEGGASGVSSETKSIVKINLKGKAYDLSSVDISGEVSPYLGDYDVKVKFNALPMPLVSPYMVQFAGYKVEKGKMTLELGYKVANKRLTASNKLLIDQFELGDQVDNPDAIPVPLKLAVALLKDSKGNIDFNFPISGSLENPEFSFRSIVADALGNALRKIISSPFTALASLFDDSKEDLSTVSFIPGSSELDTLQQNKLQALAKGLQQRPTLTIGVKGVAYEKQDWPAISDDALYDQLKMRRADELNKNAAVKTRPEYIKLSDEDYRRLISDMFLEKFPNLAEKSLLGSVQLKAPQTGEFYAVAKQKLMEVINPEQERLRELSVFRARSIAKFIVQNGQIPQERVYILDTVVDKDKNEKQIDSVLSLKAN